MAKEFPELQGIFLWKDSEKDSEKPEKNPENRAQIRETGKESGPIRPSEEHTKRGGTAGIQTLNASSPAEWIRLGSRCRGFF